MEEEVHGPVLVTPLHALCPYIGSNIPIFSAQFHRSTFFLLHLPSPLLTYKFQITEVQTLLLNGRLLMLIRSPQSCERMTITNEVLILIPYIQVAGVFAPLFYTGPRMFIYYPHQYSPLSEYSHSGTETPYWLALSFSSALPQ